MARNMSFFLTTRQIRERTKTVTRRLKWMNLRAGDIVNAVVKAMGLRPGEKMQKLAEIRIVSVRREAPTLCDDADAAREGFPEKTGKEFIDLFCKHMGGGPDQIVTRIEFEYVN